MTESDIEVDDQGMEVRSDDSESDSCDSSNEFLTESSEEEEEDDEADPEWLPSPPKDKKRISVKPVRFADQVFDSSEEEETTDDESESE